MFSGLFFFFSVWIPVEHSSSHFILKVKFVGPLMFFFLFSNFFCGATASDSRVKSRSFQSRLVGFIACKTGTRGAFLIPPSLCAHRFCRSRGIEFDVPVFLSVLWLSKFAVAWNPDIWSEDCLELLITWWVRAKTYACAVSKCRMRVKCLYHVKQSDWWRLLCFFSFFNI